MSEIISVLKATITDWLDDEAPRHAAALAYYTAFSLAPLLLIVIVIASTFVGREAVTGRLSEQMGGVISGQGAEVIEELIASAKLEGAGGVATIVGVVTALFGASGLFGNLQAALNAMWEVEPKPGRGIIATIKDRFFSFTMVLGIAFLLIVSLLLSAVLSSLGEFVTGLMPEMEVVVNIINFLITLGVIALLFAAMYKVLPDVQIDWSDVWIGGLATAVLFTIGQYLLGWYISNNNAGAAYGTAGSLIALLLWVYYSAQILLLGAEFTQVYANRYGSHIKPDEDAQWTEDAERASDAQEQRPDSRPVPVSGAPVDAPTAVPVRPGVIPAVAGRPRNRELAQMDLRPALAIIASFVAGIFVARR